MSTPSGQQDLAGIVAVVTGASRGLGREIALALNQRGASVVVAARSRTDLEETVSLAPRSSIPFLAVRTDVSRPADVTALKVQTEGQLGHASILVNAAAVFGPLAPFSRTDVSKWVETISINTTGPYLTCRAFVPVMIEAGWGRIINVSSAAALYPPDPLDSAYATSKAALNRMTRHLAAELAGTRVTANVIHPGSFKTKMWDDIGTQARRLHGVDTEFREWTELIDRTGGDPMSIAVDLVLELIDPENQTNGQFCWPRDGLEEPVASW